MYNHFVKCNFTIYNFFNNSTFCLQALFRNFNVIINSILCSYSVISVLVVSEILFYAVKIGTCLFGTCVPKQDMHAWYLLVLLNYFKHVLMIGSRAFT